MLRTIPTKTASTRALAILRTLILAEQLQTYLRTQVTPFISVGAVDADVRIYPWANGSESMLGIHVPNPELALHVGAWLKTADQQHFRHYETTLEPAGPGMVQVRIMEEE